jgi:hypothetical protein
MVGQVAVGGDAPVVVQSMTNTDTVDVVRTAIQCAELARAGSELVRITVNTPEAAAAVAPIREHLGRMGVDVPLIGDFHYNGHRLLAEHPDCAQGLAKYRINPGNVGHGRKRDEQFSQMIEIACRYEKPVRIGVNWGSLDPGSAGADHGRECPLPGAARCHCGDARSDGGLGARISRSCRGTWHAGEPDHLVGQGFLCAGPHRGLSRHGVPLRLPFASGAD